MIKGEHISLPGQNKQNTDNQLNAYIGIPPIGLILAHMMMHKPQITISIKSMNPCEPTIMPVGFKNNNNSNHTCNIVMWSKPDLPFSFSSIPL